MVSDPELKKINGGISVTTFRIAVDRTYVKGGSERQVDFFDVVARRGSAEFICHNFPKGALIAIGGQLQSRQYVTKDGQNRTAIEIIVDDVSFTGERDNDNTDRISGSQIRKFSEDGGSQEIPGYADNMTDFQGWFNEDDLPFCKAKEGVII